jgi:hypothetical protein
MQRFIDGKRRDGGDEQRDGEHDAAVSTSLQRHRRGVIGEGTKRGTGLVDRHATIFSWPAGAARNAQITRA